MSIKTFNITNKYENENQNCKVITYFIYYYSYQKKMENECWRDELAFPIRMHKTKTVWKTIH